MSGITLKLWPPSDVTRHILVERMTNNLSGPNIFTDKYGILSKDKAVNQAARIENTAFTSASENYEEKPDGDGMCAVQLYVTECSRLVMETLKNGGTNEDNGTFPNETAFDISKGHRAFIEEEEAREILKPLMEPENLYAKICFSNRSFGVAAAEVAGPILTSLKDQLKDVDLSDFVAGRNEEEALEVMNIFSKALEGCNLRSLNLSDNELGEKGVRAFGELLQSQSNLEQLYLLNDGISEEAAKAVCELIPSTKKLRVLHFHNNMTGDEGALAISEILKISPLLEDFRCSSTRVGSVGGSALSEALGTCTYLKKLDLRDNMFGSEAGIMLSKSLSKLDNLTEVYFSYLNLEDEGAIAVANVLKETSPMLEVFEMAGNEITAEAASSLAACIESKHRLTRLNLAENELEDEGMIVICAAIEKRCPELKEVDMSQNNLRRAGARLLAQAVVQKYNFKLLNINSNAISDEGIDEVKNIFKKFPDRLGPLDENDADGTENEEDSDDLGEGSEDELDLKLQNLKVNEK